MKQRKIPDLSETRPQYHSSREKMLYFRRVADHDVTLKSLVLNRIKRIDHSKLTFSLDNLWVRRPFFKRIKQFIRFNKGVKTLSLDWGCSNDKVTYKNLLSLSQSLKRLKCLKGFTLEATCSKMTEAAFVFLFNEVGKMSSLKQLCLDLCNTHGQIDIEIDLNKVIQGLKKLAGLRNFCLNLSGVKHAGDQGLKKFNRLYNRLSRLEKISQKNSSRPRSQMTDDCLKTFQLKRLVSLKEIYLNMARLVQITDKGLYYLTQGLSELASLQKIKLDFSLSKNFGVLGMHNIWQMMKSLPVLQGITLLFNQGAKITDAACHDMYQSLGCLPVL